MAFGAVIENLHGLEPVLALIPSRKGSNLQRSV
jgi:hypothetical protein